MTLIRLRGRETWHLAFRETLWTYCGRLVPMAKVGGVSIDPERKVTCAICRRPR